MKADHPDVVLKAFPRTRYFPKCRLVTWHPQGVLDDVVADQIVDFIEMEECIQTAPFDRFLDLSGQTHVRLQAGHLFQIARRRHRAIQPVKSALWANKVITLSVAYVYETLMASATIKVRVFREREAAAEWLGVPLPILDAPEDPIENQGTLKT